MYLCAGGVITNLTAEQTGLTTVQVTWTAPPDPPTGGYQITVAEAGIDVTGQESPYTFNTSELGVHTVQVMHMYTSQHFPNEEAVTVDVTVDGEEDSSHEYCHTLHVYTQVSMEHLSLHHH